MTARLRWSRIAAAVLGATLALWLLAGDVTPDARQPEAAMGVLPLPEVVGMTQACAGFVLASGVVTSSGEHELRGTPASVSIGGYTVMVPRPDLPTWQRVIEAHGQPHDLVLRPVKPREQQLLRRVP